MGQGDWLVVGAVGWLGLSSVAHSAEEDGCCGGLGGLPPREDSKRTTTREGVWGEKKAGGVLLSHGRVPHYPRRWSP